MLAVVAILDSKFYAWLFCTSFVGGEWRKIRINAICKGTSDGIPNIHSVI